MYSACWGGCDQSLEWSESTFSLRYKCSVITPLSESTHGKTALCSLHFKSYQGLMFSVLWWISINWKKWGEKKHVALCCCSACTPKIIPAWLQLLTDNIVEVCAGLVFKSRSRKVISRTHPIPLYIHSLFTRCPLWIIFFPTRPFPLNLDLVSWITHLNSLY